MMVVLSGNFLMHGNGYSVGGCEMCGLAREWN